MSRNEGMAVNPAGRWVSPRDVSDGARMRLFCLPHAGSGAAAFYRWRGRLPAGVDLCPIHLPGRGMRLVEPSYTDAARLIDDLIPAITPHLDRPFAIFGHSMGALLGFEWARRLHETQTGPELLILSGRDAPHLPEPHQHLHTLDDDQLVTQVNARYDGLPGGLLEDAELREIFLPILRADLELVETYTCSASTTVSCPIVAIASRNDRSVSTQGIDAWRQLTSGTFETALFRGNHFYLHAGGGKPLLDYLSVRLEMLMGQTPK